MLKLFNAYHYVSRIVREISLFETLLYFLRRWNCFESFIKPIGTRKYMVGVLETAAFEGHVVSETVTLQTSCD